MLCGVPGYLLYYISELKREKIETETEDASTKNEETFVHLEGMPKVILLILMTGFYFAIAGIENSFSGFITTFAVSSSHSLTRKKAADLQAIFYSTFAACRGLIIPLSAFIS